MSIDVRVNLDDDAPHEDATKFDELQAYLKQITNGERYGNAETLRLAVRLGHERMEEIQKNRNETVEEFKKYEKKLERLTK